MAIVQETFDIPDDIATGLATGIYKRCGGVIRYAVGSEKGRIVKHLDPVNEEMVEQTQGVGAQAFRFMKDHKEGFIIGTALVSALAMGTMVYYKWQSREPKELTEFRSALKIYIDAIREGNLDISQINELIDAFNNLRQNKDFEKINIQLSADDFGLLVDQIYQYTIKLAADNSIILDDDEPKLNEGEIINLQKYLEMQKEIFQMAS